MQLSEYYYCADHSLTAASFQICRDHRSPWRRWCALCMDLLPLQRLSEHLTEAAQEYWAYEYIPKSQEGRPLFARLKSPREFHKAIELNNDLSLISARFMLPNPFLHVLSKQSALKGFSPTHIARTSDPWAKNCGLWTVDSVNSGRALMPSEIKSPWMASIMPRGRARRFVKSRSGGIHNESLKEVDNKALQT